MIFGANASIYNNFSISIPKEAIIYNFEQLYDSCRNVWGIHKVKLIAKSKIILNIHYYLTGILETPRISQVVANKKFIISELSNSDDQVDWPGIVFVPYNELVNTVLHYFQKTNECMNLAKKAYEYFKLSGFTNNKS